MGESTRDLMARTDPVGYQDCIDAGRFPPAFDLDDLIDEYREDTPPPHPRHAKKSYPVGCPTHDDPECETCTPNR